MICPGVERIMVDEGLLHRVECPGGAGQPFDRRDLARLSHNREGHARQFASAVHEHGAGTTLAMVAPLLRASEADMIAQSIQQASTDIQRQTLPLAVDGHHDIDGIARIWFSHGRLRGSGRKRNRRDRGGSGGG
jgi:hypothetical protein